MVEPTGPKIVPTQATVRRRAEKWAAMALLLVLAGLACALIGEFEWGMALWGVAFWPYGRAEEARGWVDGYSAGILTGVKASDVHIAKSYADGFKDGRAFERG